MQACTRWPTVTSCTHLSTFPSSFEHHTATAHSITAPQRCDYVAPSPVTCNFMRTALRTTALRTGYFMRTSLRTESFAAAPIAGFYRFFCPELGRVLTAAIGGFLAPPWKLPGNLCQLRWKPMTRSAWLYDQHPHCQHCRVCTAWQTRCMGTLHGYHPDVKKPTQ